MTDAVIISNELKEYLKALPERVTVCIKEHLESIGYPVETYDFPYCETARLILEVGDKTYFEIELIFLDGLSGALIALIHKTFGQDSPIPGSVLTITDCHG